MGFPRLPKPDGVRSIRTTDACKLDEQQIYLGAKPPDWVWNIFPSEAIEQNPETGEWTLNGNDFQKHIFRLNPWMKSWLRTAPEYIYAGNIDDGIQIFTDSIGRKMAQHIEWCESHPLVWHAREKERG